MKLNPDSDKPIFLQISEGIEDGILTEVFRENEQIPSITEFSVSMQINPATALKGINRLVDEDILFKKRGVGNKTVTENLDKTIQTCIVI